VPSLRIQYSEGVNEYLKVIRCLARLFSGKHPIMSSAHTVESKYLGTICLSVITVILFAGLWPRDFNSGNDVAVLPDGKGIHFSRRGIIYTKDMLAKRHAQSEPGSLSIEIAIQADMVWNNSVPVIFAIDDGQSCEHFIIGQWKSSLIIRSILTDSCRYDRLREIGIRDALLKGTSRFISITSDSRGTAVYIDGKLKAWRKELSLLHSDEMLTGQLVLGNSAIGKDPWTGTLYGLAIYDHVLISEEVIQHYEVWRDNGSFATEIGPLPIALYLFNTRTGPVLRDRSGLGNDLVIPDNFTPLRRRMLALPWEDFRANQRYTLDIAINILGFIPFGFFISWYLSKRGNAHLRVVIIVLVLGIGTSLFIEIIQAYLPARSSQLMDVLSNSVGTALGICLWRLYILHLHHVTINYRRNNQ
jgi:VanZ family protein